MGKRVGGRRKLLNPHARKSRDLPRLKQMVLVGFKGETELGLTYKGIKAGPKLGGTDYSG